MGQYLECDGCGTRIWVADSDWYPFYCSDCKKRPTLDADDVLDIHEKLKKVTTIKVIA